VQSFVKGILYKFISTQHVLYENMMHYSQEKWYADTHVVVNTPFCWNSATKHL